MKTDENLRGRTVIAADGRAIGQTIALLVDETTWHVDSIRVELYREIADEIGVRRSMFHKGTVEIPVRSVQSVGDAIVLSVSVSGLREAEATEPPPPMSPHQAPIH